MSFQTSISNVAKKGRKRLQFNNFTTAPLWNELEKTMGLFFVLPLIRTDPYPSPRAAVQNRPAGGNARPRISCVDADCGRAWSSLGFAGLKIYPRTGLGLRRPSQSNNYCTHPARACVPWSILVSVQRWERRSGSNEGSSQNKTSSC